MRIKRISRISSCLKILVMSTALGEPATATAGGLGALISCGLTEVPLVARVPIIDLQYSRPEDVTVALASGDQLELAGVSHTEETRGLVIGADWANPSAPAIQISGCVQADGEPLTLLLEMRWPTGRLFRQYAVPRRIQPVNGVPDVQRIPPLTFADEELILGPRSASAAMASNNVATEKPALVSGSVYRVKSGDTLWSIASQLISIKSVNDRIDDIFAANPSAFLDRDIDLLKAGAVLRMP
jgi:pilus assembly protein FimV